MIDLPGDRCGCGKLLDCCGNCPTHGQDRPVASAPRDREQQFVTQTLLAGRADGVPGNCVQAAVASLLGLPIEAVPHFLLWLEWNHVLVDWLVEQGYQIHCRFTAEIPNERCIAAGTSPRGIRHVCVAEGGEIVWDPHPSRDGLTAVDEVWIIERKVATDV